jgi:hypothetical protein
VTRYRRIHHDRGGGKKQRRDDEIFEDKPGKGSEDALDGKNQLKTFHHVLMHTHVLWSASEASDFALALFFFAFWSS